MMLKLEKNEYRNMRKMNGIFLFINIILILFCKRKYIIGKLSSYLVFSMSF